MSGRRRKRRPPSPPPSKGATATVEETDERPRRAGPFGSALLGSGASSLPPIGRSVGRGFLSVASQPVLVVLTCVLVVASWLVFIAIGFEGAPSRLVDVLAMPPISTYFDLGTGSSLYGFGPSFLAFVGVSVVVRTFVYSALAGLVLEALEDGRVSRYGLLRAVQAIPTVFLVQVASFSLIVAGGYLIYPLLGPGIGFLGFVAALVAGLFFLGFAPTAAIRQRRPAMETIRRSARAAMLPGGRHILFCSLYFFFALPVVVGFAPGGDITANPTLTTWVYVLFVNVLHVGFMAAFAYRWVVAEPEVPEEPVRRRAAARTPTAARRR